MTRSQDWAPIVIGATLVFGITATPASAAGGEMPSLVHDIGISVLLAGLLAIIFARLKIPSIAAFLVAGVFAGPLGLRQVTDPNNIDMIAQLGFILLLFMIGLEIDIRKILSSGKAIIISGIIQYPLCVIFGVAITKLLLFAGIGGPLLSGDYAPLYIGLILAGSSTLLVVKLFQENFELDTKPGRIALGLLIFQDIWAIVVILLQPNLDHPEISPILFSFVGIGLLIVFCISLSRYVIRSAFAWIAKVPELILLCSLSWCFGVVFLGMNLDATTQALFGVNFHMSVGSGMGAMIAGATIASLPYSIEIVTKVSVVKDFFVTLFFVGLGMGMPALSGFDVPILALVFAVLAILTRQIIFFPLLYVLGVDQRNAQVASVRLAQTSEFGLVIAFLGLQYGHLSADLVSAIIFAFVLTALATTPLYNHAYEIHARLKPLLTKLGFKEPPNSVDDASQEFDLAVLGFHRVASSLLHELSLNNPGILKKTLVVDYNVALHDDIRRLGAHVDYGDLSNSETLQHAGIGRAKVIMCTIPDDLLRGTDNCRLVETVRKLNPTAIIVANAVSTTASKDVYNAGADYVYLMRINTAQALEYILLRALEGSLHHFRDEQIERHGHAHERDEILK